MNSELLKFGLPLLSLGLLLRDPQRRLLLDERLYSKILCLAEICPFCLIATNTLGQLLAGALYITHAQKMIIPTLVGQPLARQKACMVTSGTHAYFTQRVRSKGKENCSSTGTIATYFGNLTPPCCCLHAVVRDF